MKRSIKFIHKISSKGFIGKNVVLVSFLSIVIVAIALLLFLPINKSKVHAAGACYPTSYYGFFTCSSDTSGGADVLNNSSPTPSSCSLNFSAGLETICPASGSTNYVANMASFTGQMNVDATTYCNNISNLGNLNATEQQNGVGALYIIINMSQVINATTSTTISPGGNYSPGSGYSASSAGGACFNFASTLNGWLNFMNNLAAKGGSVNFDFCKGQPAGSSTKADDCDYTFTGNTWSYGNDIYMYPGQGSGRVPAIAFWFNNTTMSGKPNYVIKYFCGNPIYGVSGTSSPPQTTEISGLTYYNAYQPNRTVLYNPLPNINIAWTDCTGNSEGTVTSNTTFGAGSPSYSQSPYDNYFFNLGVGDNFCLTPQSVYYPTGSVIFANPVIRPNFAAANFKGNCAGNSEIRYVNQDAGTSNSDTTGDPPTCQYGMGGNNGYEVAYTQYYLNPQTELCTPDATPGFNDIEIKGASDFVAADGMTFYIKATLQISGPGVTGTQNLTVPSPGSGGPNGLANYSFDTAYLNGTGSYIIKIPSGTNPSYVLTGTVFPPPDPFNPGGWPSGVVLNKTITIPCAPSGPANYPYMLVDGGNTQIGIAYSNQGSNACYSPPVNQQAQVIGNANAYSSQVQSGSQLATFATANISNYASGTLNTTKYYSTSANQQDYLNQNNGNFSTGLLLGNYFTPTNIGGYTTGVNGYINSNYYGYLDHDDTDANYTQNFPLCQPDYYDNANSLSTSTNPDINYQTNNFSSQSTVYNGNTYNYQEFTNAYYPTDSRVTIYNYNSSNPLMIQSNLTIPNSTHTIILDSKAPVYIGCSVDYIGYTSASQIESFEIITNQENIYVSSCAQDLEGTYIAQNANFFTCATVPTNASQQPAVPLVDPYLDSSKQIYTCSDDLHIFGNVSALNAVFNRTDCFNRGTSSCPAATESELIQMSPEEWIPSASIPTAGNSVIYSSYTKLPPKL